MDLQQINKISEDKELMSEIVFAIRELNRAQNQSNESSEEESQAQEGQEMYVQEDGRWVWVDTRTGYQKYIDKWIIDNINNTYIQINENFFSCNCYNKWIK